MAQAGPQRQVLVFVHGVNSGAGCWDQLKGLLESDSRIAGRFDQRFHEYPTHLTETNRLRAVPPLRPLGESLRDFLVTLEGYSSITLVGHSHGGLVIQQFLAAALNGNARSLRPIRQIIMIATPGRGSTIFTSPRTWPFKIPGLTAQRERLRELDEEAGDVVATVAGSIVNATKRTDNAWPLPVYSFYGLQDDVVTRELARGPCDSAHLGALNGDHFSVIRATSTDDSNYKRISDLILSPIGHNSVFEIATYDTRLRPAPPSGVHRLVIEQRGKRRTIEADNTAQFHRTVTLSPGNTCRNLFTLRYSTEEHGWLSFQTSHTNEAAADDVADFERTDRRRVVFAFRPQENSAVYWLEVEVFGGFGDGANRLHYHLNSNLAHYAHVTFTLDLRQFLAAEWQLIGAPRLWVRSPSPSSCVGCAGDDHTPYVPYEDADTPGVWKWRLSDLSDAAVYVLWEGTLEWGGRLGAKPRRRQASPAPAPGVAASAGARGRVTARRDLERKRRAGEFDVFLCHNVADKPAVIEIADRLLAHGVLPWLDERELQPGIPWQRVLEEQIANIRAAAVFVGSDGIGPWQRHEIEGFLLEFQKRNCPVIPVILANVAGEPQLPLFLRGMTWVDFRSLDPEPLTQLVFGITGQRSGHKKSARRS